MAKKSAQLDREIAAAQASSKRAGGVQRAMPRELKTIREWLFDYFAVIDGTEMVRILRDIGTREVESFEEARAQVNRRIDAMIDWLDHGRPAGQIGWP